MRARMPAFRIDPRELARGRDLVGEALEWASTRVASEPVLVYATDGPDAVKAVHAELGAAAAGELVESALSRIAAGLVELGVGQLIVAGGETSGAVVQRLGIRGLRIGPEIDPGVPWTASLEACPRRASPGARAQVRQLRPRRLLPEGLEPIVMTALSDESRLREQIAAFGRSLFERGLTAGSSGNISARLDDGWLLTPTNACLGQLDPARIAKLDWSGRLVAGDPPSKEAPLHRAMYDERAGAGAIVHLHSTHSAAVSCMDGLDAADCIPPLTAYYVMKIGRLPLVPYHRPGDPALGDAIRGLAGASQRRAARQPRAGRVRRDAGRRGLRDRGTRGDRQAVPPAARLADAAVGRGADRGTEGRSSSWRCERRSGSSHVSCQQMGDGELEASSPRPPALVRSEPRGRKPQAASRPGTHRCPSSLPISR